MIFFKLKCFFHFQVTQDHHTQTHHGRQHTITINDTPSPAVSVITISDSDDESTPGKTNRNVQTNTTHPNRKNVISCVSVPDSDNEDRSSSKVLFYLHYNKFPLLLKTTFFKFLLDSIEFVFI